MRLKLISFITILLFVSPAWAATYYMRADGTAANKAAATSCSAASTAMSIATHNGETFSGDDVINLCDTGGNYKSYIIAPSSGTNGHPIIYRNSPGATPILDMTTTISSSGWTDLGGGLYRKSLTTMLLFEDNVSLKSATSSAVSNGNFYCDHVGNLYYRPTSGTPSNHTVEDLNYYSFYYYGALDLNEKSYITVYGLTFDRCPIGIYFGSNLTTPTATTMTGITIHDNTMTRCHWGIFGNISNHTAVVSNASIYNNICSYCEAGISVWTNSDTAAGHSEHHTGHTITENQVLHLGSVSSTLKFSAAYLYYAYGVDREGISFQDIQNSTISGNYVQTDLTDLNDTQRAIYFFLNPNGTADTSGNSVLGNYISGYFQQDIYVEMTTGTAGFQNNTIAYNIINSSSASGNNNHIYIWAITTNPETGINYLVNNTLYTASGLPLGFAGTDVGYWVVRNNIVDSAVTSYFLVNVTTPHLTIDHNLYYPNAASGGFQIGGSGLTYAQWQGDGYDTSGSITSANPLFVNASGTYSLVTDFKLQADSAAKWAGVNVGLTTDYDDKPVHNPPSIGAYEYNPNTALYASFPGYGLYSWNGTAWNELTPLHLTSMVDSGSMLYVDFPGAGIWKYDGTTWSQVTPNSPISMAASGSLLYGNFGTGAGIWKYDGTTWSQITPYAPISMAASGSLLYGNFGTGAGIWMWDGTTWSQITPNSPTSMVTNSGT
ncbi:MAG: hypothetical protein ACLP9S_07450 [Syntrophales bacterium]